MLYPELVIFGHCNFDTRKLCGDLKSSLGVWMLLSKWYSAKKNTIIFNTQVLVGSVGYIGK